MSRHPVVLPSAVLLALVACGGDGTGPVVAPSLAPRYVARAVDGRPVPAVLSSGPGSTISVRADTLLFDTAAGRYTERAVVALQVDGQPEQTSRVSTETAGTAYHLTGGTLTVATFLGGSGTGTLAGDSLVIAAADGRRWSFAAR